MRVTILGLSLALLLTGSALAQDTPADYQGVLATLGKTGDFKDGVLKVNLPRNDLKVTIAGRPAPTPFGFGGWVALTKGEQGHDVLMGDLVLTEDQVSPVMSALVEHGFDVTAVHNHFFREQPRIFYMHVHGMGTAADLAARLKPVVAIVDQAAAKTSAPAPARRCPAGARDGHRGAREDRRACRRSERRRLQDHDRPARHRPARARRRDQFAHGTEHVGGVHGDGCRRDGRGGRRDAGRGSDVGGEGAAGATASTSSRCITT